MKYRVICPLCHQEHVEDCEGCTQFNVLVCQNSMVDGVPQDIDLDDYGLKWEPILETTA